MPRFARFARPVLAAAVFALAPLFAQPVLPAAQDRVAAIGSSPLRAPLTAEFSPGTAFTLEAWVCLTAATESGWIAGKSLATNAAPFISFALQIGAGQRPQFVYSTGAAGSYGAAVAPAPLALRTWTHLAAVMDGSVARLLVNGTVVATFTAAGAPPAPAGVPFALGRSYFANGSPNYSPFDGFARQVRFWNVARSAAQIAAALGESLPSDRTGLMAAWPLDETTGALTARDISGANRHLTGAGVMSANTALVTAGPFYAATTTPAADPAMRFLQQGVLIDFDGDGDLDAVYAQSNYTQASGPVPQRLRAFRNNNGTFVDVTDAVLGTVTLVHPRHQLVGDFTGDGRPDILFAGHGYDYPPHPGEQSRLLVGTPDGRLVEDPARLPSASSDFTHNVAATDIDRDGDLDIFLCNSFSGPRRSRLYLNDGRGFFTENTSRLPAEILDAAHEPYLASLFVDVNRDGWPDLVLGPFQTGQNDLFMNDGTGRFVRDPRFVLPPKLVGPLAYTVNIESADFNGDGWPDLVLSTDDWQSIPPNGVRVSAAVQLLINRGDGTFTDATATSGIVLTPRETWTEWIYPMDFSGDGRPDLVLRPLPLGDHRTTRLLENLGTNPVTFRDVTEILNPPHLTTVLLPGDIDLDGRIDFLSATPDSLIFYRNLQPLVAGRLANLSVRTQAGAGDATLIAGFALGAAGPGAAPTKPLLVRAVGPTLSAFGVDGALADPALAFAPLNQPSTAANDNWSGAAALKAAFASVGAFAFASDASRDAALLVSPAPGAYTASVSGGSGVALVEIYDAGAGNTPRLTNVSARAVAGTGANALIAGFVIDGTLPKRVLIRAVGPTLSAFGVGGALADPVLEVRPLGGATIVARNDDWGGTAALKAAFASVAAFALVSDVSRDAALAIELPAGAYTAAVSGANATTGVALVEVYELP